jgi:hypothetical protein
MKDFYFVNIMFLSVNNGLEIPKFTLFLFLHFPLDSIFITVHQEYKLFLSLNSVILLPFLLLYYEDIQKREYYYSRKRPLTLRAQ